MGPAAAALIATGAALCAWALSRRGRARLCECGHSTGLHDTAGPCRYDDGAAPPCRCPRPTR